MTLRRLALSFVPAAAIAAAAVATRPLGPLAGTMLLVVVLPPLAASLDALGWAEIVAGQIKRARLSATRRLLTAYGTWLAVSATLTLDVAAVVAVPVGLRLADDNDERAGRGHVGAAILGSNIGSLLFPFSNLTNLVVVSASGTSFAAYVGAAWAPQLVAAVAVGALLAHRTGRRTAASDRTGPGATTVASIETSQPTTERPPNLALIGGVVAMVSAIAAVGVGFAGGDVAPVFAFAAAVVAGCAVASGSRGTRPTDLASTIPRGGVAVVLFAAVAIGPMVGLASLVPDPQGTLPIIVALPAIALVGGLLAVTLNNLPAAAFGAIWLAGGSPDAVVAFLVGANFVAIATPHGSLATVLCRRLAAQGGIELGLRTYLGTAWRYATVAGIPALIALIVVH